LHLHLSPAERHLARFDQDQTRPDQTRGEEGANTGRARARATQPTPTIAYQWYGAVQCCVYLHTVRIPQVSQWHLRWSVVSQFSDFPVHQPIHGSIKASLRCDEPPWRPFTTLCGPPARPIPGAPGGGRVVSGGRKEEEQKRESASRRVRQSLAEALAHWHCTSYCSLVWQGRGRHESSSWCP
jgi:hypothetical protein